MRGARDVHAPDLELHVLAQLAVERAERLVHQQDVGLDHHGARQRDALLLAARELADLAVREPVEPDDRQRLLDPARDLGPRDAPDLEPVGDVLEDAHVREQGVVLEHHADVAASRRLAGDVAPVDEEPARSSARDSRRRC